jgi:hypothetical protein
VHAVQSTVLARDAWQARATAHAKRVDTWVQPHLARRRRGIAHPVHDFLFTYYSQRPATLRRWHPGYGVTLLDAPEYADLRGYGIVRHVLPPRLGRVGTDRVVESHRISCSHFDAFRFFTESARPLNTLQPARDDRASFEQPGCLHAGMDLYKHAFRLSPLVASELVADCFALAWDIRELDMRASPYDLSDLGYKPVPIETPEGKAEYVAAQRAFAERGAPLRQQLIEVCDALISPAGRVPADPR